MIQLNHTYSGIPFETSIAGELAAADPLPTAVLYRNGSASGVTVTVTTTAVVGLYHCSFTTDAGWAKTDRLYLQVSATLGSITDRRVIWDSFAEPDAVMRGTDNGPTKAELDAAQTSIESSCATVSIPDIADAVRVELATELGQINDIAGTITLVINQAPMDAI